MAESGILDVKASTDEANRENAEDVSGISNNEVSNQPVSDKVSLIGKSGNQHQIVRDLSESGPSEKNQSAVMEDTKDNVVLDHVSSSPNGVEIKYQPFIADLSKKDYSEDLLSQMFHMYEKSILVDFKIKLQDDTIISCHKSILCAKSEYFMTLFTSDFDDRMSSEADFQCFNPECARKVLEYCYTGEINCDWEKIEDLLDVVCYLGLPDLLEEIDEFVSWKVTPENAVHWFEETSVRDLPSTRNTLFIELLKSIYSSAHFRSVSLTELMDRLRYDGLRCSEEDVFQAAWFWWNCDNNIKLDPDGTVFDCVRFKFLSESLDQLKVIIGDEKKDLLPINLKKYLGLGLPDGNDINTNNPSTEAKSMDNVEDVNEKTEEVIQRHYYYCVKDIILVETTNNDIRDYKGKKCLYFVSDQYKCPIFLTDFPEGIYDQTLCVTPKGIMFTGGRYNTLTDEADNITDKCYLYDIYCHDILNLPNVKEERCGHTCVMVGSKMFAIGGDCYEEETTLDDEDEAFYRLTWKTTVLCLDTYNMNWTSHSMIPVEMLILSTAVIEKSIYILGRTRPTYIIPFLEDDTHVDMFFYRYDTEQHNWLNLPLPTKRFMSDPCLYASGSKVYLAYAHRKMHTIYCEMYDTELDIWERLNKLSGLNRLNKFTSFVLHDKLMACLENGQLSADISYVFFDMDLKKWNVFKDKFPANVCKSWRNFADFPFKEPCLSGRDANKLYHTSLVLTPEDESMIKSEKRLVYNN